jgi:adenylate cyclase
MAEFSSTAEAVRCAIEIQEEIVAHNSGKDESEQMWFCIGLNVGDVIVEGDDLIGNGVNIASRMG